MALFAQLLVGGIFPVLFHVAEASIICGDFLCSGTGAYCCGISGGRCCFSVWTFWWFWMIWLMLFTCMISCGWWCGRRYRQRYRNGQDLIIVRQPESAQVYGTVTASSAAPAYAPTAPQKPPEYTDQAPPAYSNYGKPPEYAPS